MSVRDHKRKAEGKRQRGRRMPSPSEVKMGTQTHEFSQPEDERIPEIARCDRCEKYVEEEELEECESNVFLCYDCMQEEVS